MLVRVMAQRMGDARRRRGFLRHRFKGFGHFLGRLPRFGGPIPGLVSSFIGDPPSKPSHAAAVHKAHGHHPHAARKQHHARQGKHAHASEFDTPVTMAGMPAGPGGAISDIAGALGGMLGGHGHPGSRAGGGGHRRMHVTNPKALRRAMRRVEGFAKLAHKTIQFVHHHKLKRRGGRKR